MTSGFAKADGERPGGRVVLVTGSSGVVGGAVAALAESEATELIDGFGGELPCPRRQPRPSMPLMTVFAFGSVAMRGRSVRYAEVVISFAGGLGPVSRRIRAVVPVGRRRGAR
jgi:hypothetical protein